MPNLAAAGFRSCGELEFAVAAGIMKLSPLWWRMFLRFCFLVVFILSTHFCVHLLTCARDYGPVSAYTHSLCRRSGEEIMSELSGGAWPGGTRRVAAHTNGLSFLLPQDGLQLRVDDGEPGGLDYLDTPAVPSGFKDGRRRPGDQYLSNAGHGFLSSDAGLYGETPPKKAGKVVKLRQPKGPGRELLQDNMTYHSLFDFNTRVFHRLTSVCGSASSQAVALEVRPDKGWRLDCPDFWECGRRFEGLAAVCLNSQGPFPGSIPEHLLDGDHPARRLLTYGEYFGTTVLLSNVYTNYHAQTFDSENLYLKGGCGEHFSNPLYESGVTNVTRFDVAINLAMGLFNYYHALIESVPKWAVMLPIIRSMPGVPVLVSRNDGIYRYVLQVLGIQSLAEFNVHYLEGQTDLVYANTMITPMNQPCGHSSVVAWEKIRRDHMHLEEQDERSVFDRVEDWYIVVGYRNTTRRIDETSTLVGSLAQTYGESRVKLFLYKDSMKRHLLFKQIPALFSKAVIYISPHGAGMSNMVFMPYGSSIIEIRPKDFSNSCYDNLAGVLNFHYYLFYSPGGKNSTLTMEVDKVLRLVKDIVDARGYKVGPQSE